MGGLVALGAGLASDRSSIAFTIGAGVAASLAASLYALFVNYLLVGDTGVDVERFEETVANLERGAPLLEHARRHGVLAVKPKSAYPPPEWIALLEARKELFIVGHALHKWCRDHVKPSFVEAISRLVLNDGQVQLVVLPLDGEVTARLTAQRGKEYRRYIAETLETLAQISLDLPPEDRHRLDVRWLHEHAPMPYMLAGNEHMLITAPYPIAGDSDAMLAVTIAASSPAGSAMRDDLRRLVATYSKAVDLHDFLPGRPSADG